MTVLLCCCLKRTSDFMKSYRKDSTFGSLKNAFATAVVHIASSFSPCTSAAATTASGARSTVQLPILSGNLKNAFATAVVRIAASSSPCPSAAATAVNTCGSSAGSFLFGRALLG